MVKVSVVIPSYNRADYIPATLDSVLAQTFTDFEIIFVDDGSTDDTKQILEKYTKRDLRVKYIWQENSERAVARTNGINHASGEYVCLLDSDDLWYPKKLEKQIAIMEKKPNIVLCYASVNRIDFHSKKIKAASRQHDGFSGTVFEKLLERNFVPSVTPMVRTSVLRKIGAQKSEYIPYEDWDFWLRVSRHGDFYHIREPLGDYRIHPAQSVQNVNAEKISKVTIKILEDNVQGARREGLELSDAVINKAYSLAYLRIAYWYILAGKPKLARQKLGKSFASCPDRKYDYRWYGLYLASFTKGSANGLLAGLH